MDRRTSLDRFQAYGKWEMSGEMIGPSFRAPIPWFYNHYCTTASGPEKFAR